MITIKTIPSKYFFSGDINLSGGKESQVDLDTLTKTQVLDIIEAEITRVLIVSDIDAIKEKYREILEGKPFDPGVINKRLGTIEDTLDNLTIGQVASVTDKVVRYTQGDKASPTSIMCAIDFEPFEFFESLGLTSTEVPITE